MKPSGCMKSKHASNRAQQVEVVDEKAGMPEPRYFFFFFFSSLGLSRASSATTIML